MSKFDILNSVLTLKETEEYIEDVFDDLEEIYHLDEPPKGKRGAIWRTIWGRPRRGTPMSYYISLKLLEEIKNNSESLKIARKKARDKERTKLSNLITNLERERDDSELEAELIQEELSETIKQRDSYSEQLDVSVEEKEKLEESYSRYRKRIESGKKISNEHFVKDITMLIQRLRRYELVEIEDLVSVRMSQQENAKLKNCD